MALASVVTPESAGTLLVLVASRRLRTASAGSAPSSERSAATANAGRNPALTLAAVPRWPLAAKTAVATATPKTLPKRWTVLFAPEALPMSGGATALGTAGGAVAIAIDTP